MIYSEKPEDVNTITSIHIEAFKPSTAEAILVEHLRKNCNFNTELSLFAFEGDTAIGHILFFPLSIETKKGSVSTLALCPLAVLPAYQHKGYGSQLVRVGLQKAKELGYTSVFVVGSTGFYERFGFHSVGNIQNSLADFGKHFMSLELQPDSLKNVTGILRYTREFDIVK